MATFVLTNAYLSVGGVDLSDHVRSVSITHEAEAVDDTHMGDTTRLMLGGLLNNGFDVEFSQDYAASKVDATLWPLVGTATAIVLQPVNNSGTATATNPTFTGTLLMTTYSGISGAVGDKAIATASFVPGSTGITRNIS